MVEARVIPKREDSTAILSACNMEGAKSRQRAWWGWGWALLQAEPRVLSCPYRREHVGVHRSQYKHLASCCTVPEALRLAMLRLAHCLPADAAAVRQPEPGAVGDDERSEAAMKGECEQWTRPMHWAGFLAMGDSMRLPRGTAGEPGDTQGEDAQ